MTGVQRGDDFVSEREARQGIINFIRRTVGPRKNPKTGKPIKPDLIWAIGVMKKTIPPGVLKGAKSDEYQRALDTLFDIRDELSQTETIIGMFWQIEDAKPPTTGNDKEKD